MDANALLLRCHNNVDATAARIMTHIWSSHCVYAYLVSTTGRSVIQVIKGATPGLRTFTEVQRVILNLQT